MKPTQSKEEFHASNIIRSEGNERSGPAEDGRSHWRGWYLQLEHRQQSLWQR